MEEVQKRGYGIPPDYPCRDGLVIYCGLGGAVIETSALVCWLASTALNSDGPKALARFFFANSICFLSSSLITPGITFFMQPRELPDPILVFDDLVRSINLITKELDGQKWDAERKPLTDFTLKQIRKNLQVG